MHSLDDRRYTPVNQPTIVTGTTNNRNNREMLKHHTIKTPFNTFLSALFEGLRHGNVPYVVERNYQTLPEEIRPGGDVDLLVCPEQFPMAERLVLDCARAHALLVIQRLDGAGWTQFRLARVDQDTRALDTLQLDLKWSEQWRGMPTFDTRLVLNHRRAVNNLFAPHPAHEPALAWFGHLMHHGVGKVGYENPLIAAAQETPEPLTQLLATAFGAAEAQTIVRLLQHGDAGRGEEQTKKLREAIVRRTVSDVDRAHAQTANHVARAVQWRMSPQRFGLTLALIGPDGCGKSAVAQRILTILQSAFATGAPQRLHQRPGLLPPLRDLLRPGRWQRASSSGEPVTDPHALPASGFLGSTGRLAYYLTDYCLGHTLRVAPQTRWKRTITVYERYAYDLLADPKRLRIDLPQGMLEAAVALAPAPDVVIYLDVPAEVALQRKGELHLEELNRQRSVYQSLVNDMPNAHQIDATQSLEDVVFHVGRIALQTCAQRSAAP